MDQTRVCIAGAGIIGLSLALELVARGLAVTVVDSGPPMQQASTAAAGMLAADDPHNPREIHALSKLSVALYPAFLGRIQSFTGIAVPFQTRRTLQALTADVATPLPPELRSELLLDDSATSSDPGFGFLHENSIDPRQLAAALTSAVAATPIRTVYNSSVLSTRSTSADLVIKTTGASFEVDQFIDCTGAWAGSRDAEPSLAAVPIKGQMLALAMPTRFLLRTTLRTKDIYIVPRTVGPHQGRAIVGATVENASFDKTVAPHTIELLRQQAVALVPELADATVIDSWAGLRPSTHDGLPLIGPHPLRPYHWLATGHYRNGILLAPATARVMAQLVLDETLSTSLEAFSPARLLSARI